MTTTITIYYQSSAESGGYPGWAWCANDQTTEEQESGALRGGHGPLHPPGRRTILAGFRRTCLGAVVEVQIRCQTVARYVVR